MKSRTPLIVWGAGSHSRVVSDIVRLAGCYEIAGYLDDFVPHPDGLHVGGIPILGDRQQLDLQLARNVKHIIVAIGDCAARLKLAGLARSKGFTLASAIHPSAIVAADAVIAAGSVLVAGAIVNPGVTIGENVIINTGATIEHECIIEDGAHVSAGVHMGGKTTIGRGAWVCIGATVLDRLHIGAGSVIGAGSLVTSDIPPGVIAYGIPARVVRDVPASVTQD